MEEKELSLNEKIDLLIKNAPIPKEEEKGSSEWKMPFMTKFKSNVGKKKVERGWATIIIIRSNRNLEFTRAQIKDGMAIVDGFPRVCTVNHTLLFKNKPFYIIPEWSLKPFSPENNYSETEKENMNIAGRRAVLATLETEKIKTKKDFGSLIWIVIGAIIIGGIYYFGKSSGWF